MTLSNPRYAFFLAGAVLLSPLTACNKGPNPEKFYEDAVRGDISEIKLGSLAATKATSDHVRAFGQALAADHGQALDKARQVAISAGLTVSEAPTEKAAQEFDKLSG